MRRSNEQMLKRNKYKENNCSYDDALIWAKTGKRTGRMV